MGTEIASEVVIVIFCVAVFIVVAVGIKLDSMRTELEILKTKVERLEKEAEDG